MKERQEIRPRDEAVELIECYIQRKALTPHQKLPSERDLCELWNVNRSTLRTAIRRLTEEGKLYSVKGSGTFVAPPKLERNLQDTRSITELVRGARHFLQNKVLDIRIIECGKHVSRELQLPIGSKVFYLKRLRIMDGVPYTLESTYVDCAVCHGIEEYDFVDESLYRVLSYYGVYLTQGRETIGVTYASEDEARWLEVAEGSAMFHLTGVSCSPNGQPVEYFSSVVRPDKVRFTSILRRYPPKEKRSDTT